MNIPHKNESVKKNIPQFISDLPCGEDYTEGKAQKRLAKAIADYITSADSNNNTTRRIIGLKGEWGTGKSNVIKQIQEQLKENYYIFEYDAWGHQEDLQRRSFLETMTEQLLNNPKYNDFLSKNKKVVKSWESDKKTIEWKEKLDELLAHKRITHNKSIPMFNGGALVAAVFLALTPISSFVAERLESQKTIENIPILVLIAFCPILFGLIVWGIACLVNKDARHLGYLLKISKDATTSVKNYETINENEPSVAKFNRWMKDLSDYISEYGKHKIIIVYDNMDRLPADKVKELWSSIHTFFSEEGFANIWTIIPFDEKHLSCAFGEKEQLTKQFISKTFPIVYRVTPPVITDYQKIFNDLYSVAFGNTEDKYRHDIYRIFRLETPNATIREIIVFINSLVALKQIWKDDIELIYCAVFSIEEKKLVNNSNETCPIEKIILSGDYINDNIKHIIPNDETLQTSIASLVYGVPKDLAGQIPLIKYIESCFENRSNDINKYSQSTKFITILQETIQNADESKTDSIIRCLSNLKIEPHDNDKQSIISNLWDILLMRKEKQKLQNQEFDNSYKTLLLNVTDKEGVLQKICKKIQNFGTESNYVFDGANYYNSLRNIKEFLSQNNISINIEQYLNDIEKEPHIFIEYVQAAKDDYKSFKLYTDNNKLNTYLNNNFDKAINDLSILEYIKDDELYNFDIFKQKIEEFIPTSGLSQDNFKEIFDAYKSISNEKPLKVQLTQEQRNQIWNNLHTKVNTKEYLEIVGIQLANLVNVGGNLTPEQIKYIAEQLNYYGNYGDLLIKSNSPNLNNVLKYMTENKMGYNMQLEKLLPHFFNIKNKIGVTEEQLLTQFNCQSEFNTITTDNIQSIIPQNLYPFLKETKNNLTSHINKTAIEKLSTIDEITIYTQLNQPGQYWYSVVDNLVDTDFCNPLPNILFTIGIRYINDIAEKDLVPQNNSLKDLIINKLDRHKLGNTIEIIRNSFCNSKYFITSSKFQYLEELLREHGNLNNRASEVIHHIIDPIINDESCLNIIIQNTNFYVKLINDAGDEIDVTREKIQQMVNKSDNDKLIEFAMKIGIKKEIEK